MTLYQLLKLKGFDLNYAERCKIGMLITADAQSKDIPIEKVPEVQDGVEIRVNNYPNTFEESMMYYVVEHLLKQKK